MSAAVRVLGAGVLVLLGGTAEVFLSGQYPACLGPLGVTAVQCAKASGVVPQVGIGLPIFALAVAAAAVLVAPRPAGRGRIALFGAILGAVVGGLAFLALRPVTMEGLDSTGAWISIPRPLDLGALATAAVVAAALGVFVLGRIPLNRQVRTRRQ
jgi:hypothetical protein